MEYLQYSGLKRIQTVREHAYQNNFQVNSSNCLINFKLSSLVYYDTYYQKILNYTNETVVIDKENG